MVVDRRAHPHRSFMAGSLAGLVSTASTYPLDVARARMAVCSTYPSLTQVFLRSINEGGILSLYRGFIPTICGVIPYAGSSFFTYETLKRLHYGLYFFLLCFYMISDVLFHFWPTRRLLRQ